MKVWHGSQQTHIHCTWYTMPSGTRCYVNQVDVYSLIPYSMLCLEKKEPSFWTPPSPLPTPHKLLQTVPSWLPAVSSLLIISAKLFLAEMEGFLSCISPSTGSQIKINDKTVCYHTYSGYLKYTTVQLTSKVSINMGLELGEHGCDVRGSQSIIQQLLCNCTIYTKA